MDKHEETVLLEGPMTETIRQGSSCDHESLISYGGDSDMEDTPDASFISGWNSIAGIVRYKAQGFDPIRYLQGVTEAIDEYRQKEAEQAQMRAAHQADIQAVSEAWTRLQSAGISLTTYGGGLHFEQEQKIRHLTGPELDNGLPF